MALASLLTLLDDITMVLDDVATMTKVAAKKTAGVVGDDLALNANQVSGVKADRELPIIWSVFKGSLINKLILIPFSLLLSAFASWAITPLLMVGGAYLCFEGMEKILHKLLHKSTEVRQELLQIDEKSKIKGAVRTDFILSAEIIILALGIVAKESLLSQAIVMAIVGIGITIFVYGLVAGIVKMDDIGFWLMKRKIAMLQMFGKGLISFVPYFMRVLNFVGTVAMFIVGGGIITHNLSFLHHWFAYYHLVEGILGQVTVLGIGIITGTLTCMIVLPIMRFFVKNH